MVLFCLINQRSEEWARGFLGAAKVYFCVCVWCLCGGLFAWLGSC